MRICATLLNDAKKKYANPEDCFTQCCLQRPLPRLALRRKGIFGGKLVNQPTSLFTPEGIYASHSNGKGTAERRSQGHLSTAHLMSVLQLFYSKCARYMAMPALQNDYPGKDTTARLALEGHLLCVLTDALKESRGQVALAEAGQHGHD